VRGTGDRQELGQALNQGQDDRLKRIHAYTRSDEIVDATLPHADER
jgi:hypothetical protein